MKNMLVIGFVVLVCCGLVISHIIWENNIEATVLKSKNEFAKQQKAEEKERRLLLDNLDPSKNAISFEEFIQYKRIKEDKTIATISLLGSSVTEGFGASDESLSWAGLLESSLEDVQVINRGKGGYSTKDILENKMYQNVIKDNPDIIIFETSLLNNHGQALTLKETRETLEKIMNEFNKSLPDTKVLLISPNPSSLKLDKQLYNKLGFTYDDYIQDTTELIKSKKWYYLDSYSEINKKLRKDNVTLKSVLTDGVHPNDKGYKMWFEIIYNYIKNNKVI